MTLCYNLCLVDISNVFTTFPPSNIIKDLKLYIFYYMTRKQREQPRNGRKTRKIQTRKPVLSSVEPGLSIIAEDGQ